MSLDPGPLVARILELQDEDGAIAWVEGGLFDPWNHCEAAMGLMAAGEIRAARHAMEYLRETQRADGSWLADMGCAVPMDAANERLLVDDPPQVVDTNFIAYPAVAAWRLYLATQRAEDLARFSPMAEQALDFVISLQRDDGAIPWRGADSGENADAIDALIAGGASIYKSLETGARLLAVQGRNPNRFLDARARLGEALRERPNAFAAKSRYAMDWYYPALASVLPRAAGRRRLAQGWRAFVHPVWGCRCVDDEPWATAAETAELALACLRLGARRAADGLIAALGHAQTENGALWMGRQFVLDRYWPMERPSWTAGAALLALDAQRGRDAGARLFLDDLPERERVRA